MHLSKTYPFQLCAFLALLSFVIPHFKAHSEEPLAPEISIEQSDGSPLVNNGPIVKFNVIDTERSFTIRNLGSADLVVSDISLVALPAPFQVNADAFPITVTAGGTATFSAVFSTDIFLYVGSIRIASNDADEATFFIPVQADYPTQFFDVLDGSTNQPLTNDVTVLTFPDTVLGESSTKRIIFRSLGRTSIGLTSAHMLNSQFAPFSVVVTPSTDPRLLFVDVTFTPPFRGLRSNKIVLNIASSFTPRFLVPIVATAIGSDAGPDIKVEHPEGIRITKGVTEIDFGTVLVGSSATKTFTIRSTGSLPLILGALSKFGGNTSEFSINATTISTNPFPWAEHPQPTQTFSVTWTPTVAGLRSTFIGIESNDTSDNPFDFLVKGTAMVGPKLTVNHPADVPLSETSPSSSFGSVTVGVPQVKTFTIKNTGDAPLILSSVTKVAGGSSEMVLNTDGMLQSLQPNESTTFTVIFSPTDLGNRNATIAIASDDPDASLYQISLTGTGGPGPVIQVEKNGVAFTDNQIIGFGFFPRTSSIPVTKTETYTIKNIGSSDLTGISLQLSGFFRSSTVNTATLAPGASTSFSVSFTEGTPGEHVGLLNITSKNASNSPFRLRFHAFTVGPAVEMDVRVSPSSFLTSSEGTVQFENTTVGQSSVVKTFVISNQGSLNLQLGSVIKEGANPSDFIVDSTNMATTVAGFTSTTFTVTFNPSTIGDRAASLRISNNDLSENPFLIALAGVGLAPAPEIVVESSAGTPLVSGNNSIVLPNVVTGGTSVSTIITIRNTGLADLTDIAVTKAGDQPGDFILDTSGMLASLPPGQSTTLAVAFAPSLTGTRAATLHIASNDGDENPFVIALSGNGVPEAQEIVIEQPSGAPLTSGLTRVDFNIIDSMRTFTIRNAGLADLVVTNIVVVNPGSGFQLNPGALPKTITAGQTATFSATFSPSVAPNILTSTIQVLSNDTDEAAFSIPFLAAYSANAVYDVIDESTGATLVDDVTVLDFGTVFFGDSVTKRLIVRSLGDRPLSVNQVVSGGSFLPNSQYNVTPIATGNSRLRYLDVTYRPTYSDPGVARLVLTTNAGFNPEFLVRLTGRGVGTDTGADMKVEHPVGNTLVNGSSAIPFGTVAVGASVTKSFTIRNTGGTILNVTSISKGGAHPLEFHTNPASVSASLNPTQTQNFSVTWTPSATGERTASIAIASNDPNDSPFEIFLSGTATTGTELESPNTPPQFVKGADIVMEPSSGQRTIEGWATGIVSGVSGEPAQAVEFIVENNNPALFAVAPSISPGGTLTFTPAAADAKGEATMQVTLRDSGGTANGGQNVSTPQTFRITIRAGLEEHGTYNGLFFAALGNEPSHSRSGSCRVVVSKGGEFTARVCLGEFVYSVRGVFKADGTSTFGRLKTSDVELLRKGLPALRLQMNLDLTSDSGKLVGIVSEGTTPFADLVCDRACYTTRVPAKPPLINLAEELPGKYTAIFQALTSEEQGQEEGDYPQGDGVATFLVSKGGIAKISAKLADGTRATCTAPLSKSNTYPLFLKLFKGKGSLSGFVTFRPESETSDATGPDLLWFRPTVDSRNPGAYTKGWPKGVRVDFVASKFIALTRNAGSMLPGLPANDPNADIVFTAGGFGETGLSKDLMIAPNDHVIVIGGPNDRLRLGFTRGTGVVTGSFFHPISGQKVTIQGVCLQKSETISGYFLHETESGHFEIKPKAMPE